MKGFRVLCLSLTVFLAIIVPAWAEESHGGHGGGHSGGHGARVETKPEPAPTRASTDAPASTADPASKVTPMPIMASGSYRIVPEIPENLEKGKEAAILIEVRDQEGPVSGLLTHLESASFFGGGGHGEEGAEHGDEVAGHGEMGDDSHAGMTMSHGDGSVVIMGEEVDDGLYRFLWTPEQDGRQVLTIMAGDSQVQVPADVQGPAPNGYVLGAFGMFTAGTLGYSSYLRKQNRKEDPINEPA